jgi:ribosomal protein L16 Arg81 hydroxylase
MLEFALTPADFRSRYFERAPLLSRGALRDRLVGWPELNAAINLIEPDERTFQLFQQGLIAQHNYTRDVVEFGRQRRRLQKSTFFDYLRGGATLVLNRFETHSVECQRLCAEIARFASLPTTSNAYLSYTGEGTFGKHWDTHDVFAIQMIGRKRWQVFAPTFPLPLSHHTSGSFSQQDIGAAQLDVILEEGDVLYLPRGWWHQAIPLDEPSLHFSIGAYAATIHDFLMWVCSQWLPLQDDARRAFSATSVSQLKGDIFERLRRAALDSKAMRQFELELQHRERHHAEIDLARHVTALHVPVQDAARLRLTGTVATPLQSPQVVVNGEVLQLDRLSHIIVAALRGGASMPFAALCERIDAPRETLLHAVLGLARREVLSIEH